MITIGTIEFDSYSGDITTPKKGVAPFARTDVSGAAAQVTPTVGEPFSITTVRYEPPASVEATKITLRDSIGQLVAIIDNGLIYANAPYSLQFMILDVHHRQIQSLVRAKGSRGATAVDIAPAVRLETVWQLQAHPV